MGAFSHEAMNEQNPKWEAAIHRIDELYKKKEDMRSEFERDYTRILHCEAYRKLKHKTQVFFETQNDLVCTRIEHVGHVESVSTTIAKKLGLNQELTSAIAIGHDLGHAPFGHEGEYVLSDLMQKHTGREFWHEKNGLRVVDYLDLLEDSNRCMRTLCLTYAVRDGIISHCGEVNDTMMYPRDEAIDLNDFKKRVTNPFTWEACVVKLSDRIAYVGRDIEDAKRLQILSMPQLFELKNIAKKYGMNTINTTTLIHDLITDVCKNSTPDKGIRTSPQMAALLNEIKEYNYRNIYANNRLLVYRKYVRLVIESIFYLLLEYYEGENTIRNIRRAKHYPLLSQSFSVWLGHRSSIDLSKYEWSKRVQRRCMNKRIYHKLETKELYIDAIIDYISGMTDSYAIKVFNELCRF